MKYEALLRQVVTEGTLLLGGLAIAGGFTYYLSGLREDYALQTSVLTREAEVIEQETNDLQVKFATVQKGADLYQEAMEKQSQGKLAITRQIARDKFNQYNDQYFLGNLRITMSPTEELKEPKYKHENGIMMSSNVSVNFEAVSDEHVYSMINTMQQDMAGSTKITKVSLQRQRNVSDDILRVIGQRGTFPLVVGEIKFTWFGMKPLEADRSNAGNLVR